MGRYLLFIRPLEAVLSGINSVIEHRSPNFAKGEKKGVVPVATVYGKYRLTVTDFPDCRRQSFPFG